MTIEDGDSSLKFGGDVFISCPLATLYVGRDFTCSDLIARYPFYNNPSLRSLTIGGNVTSIGDFTFMGCSGLKEVNIEDGVTSIGVSAFCRCSGLTSLTIPNSVTSIEDGAFYGCTSLVKLYSWNTTPPTVGWYAFYEVDKERCVLTVPAGCKESYGSSDEWKEFLNIRESVPTAVEDIPANQDGKAGAMEAFDMNGRRRTGSSKGMNILRMSNGTVKKVLAK